ncbi:formylglycine-generating enzyme family protein [Paracoccus sp. MC1862]|uniref:formylglycine-generating enzyme family protein n=1 Tax=Paracoccus sp. MC1862 TaxID=2760307 RepID=UPI00190A0035|nr:formylglycine-generating enzyme family protein [Paracoccus sp. MC1862]QQO46779.1 formylglycine-generating enzyme family protein [Paracoccus sp. MC1862]
MADPAGAALEAGDRLGCAFIPGGSFLMGSDDFYPEERPVRRVTVAGFRIDRTPVTNAAFARFVAATGHVTLAERAPDLADYPGADPALLVPGSLVFRPPPGPVPLDDPRLWWAYVPGACWHRPEGPGSGLAGREDHPVVHVAHADAAAYAAWAGKALPTETEWEYAARGGFDGAAYAWGDDPAPGGRWQANIWQGAFPWQDLALDGFPRTSPVGAFPPNGYGLFDMIGNVWEWTADAFRLPGARSCCTPDGGATGPGVVKGGSHLCAPNHCRRYRPAARQPQAADSSTSHIGFRCLRRGPGQSMDEEPGG